MGSRKKWDEIKTEYPDEWVAIVDYETDAKGNIEGEVLVHSFDKDEFYRKAGELLPEHKDVAIRYTGECIKNPEVPLLWQITRTA